MIRVEAQHIEIRNPRLQRGRAILRMASDRDRGNVGFCIAILRPDLTEDDARMLLDAAPSTATAVACQTALNIDPGSASNFDPPDEYGGTPLISPAKRVGVAQPG